MKRPPYASTLVSKAVHVARITFQQRGIRIERKRGKQHVVRLDSRGEGLPILSNCRTWS